MKYIKPFNESKSNTMEVVIDGETYIIKKSIIDLNKFDSDGYCKEYCDKSYVIIDESGIEDKYPRVRILNGIFDENNEDGPFDPLNYSDLIHGRLDHGDECYIEDLYDIISTTNKSGEIYYDYLSDYSSDDFKNGITIHKDLISKAK